MLSSETLSAMTKGRCIQRESPCLNWRSHAVHKLMGMAFGALLSDSDPYSHKTQDQSEHDRQVKPEVLGPGIENFRAKLIGQLAQGKNYLPWFILRGAQHPIPFPQYRENDKKGHPRRASSPSLVLNFGLRISSPESFPFFPAKVALGQPDKLEAEVHMSLASSGTLCKSRSRILH